MLLRRVKTLILAGLRSGVLWLALLASPAAMAATCERLASQLANLDSAEGGNTYDGAASRQRQELARAQSQYARLGCDGGGGGACANLSGIISQMNSNLARLERHSRRGNSGASRARILRAMDKAGCNARRPAREQADEDVPPRTRMQSRQEQARRARPARQEEPEQTGNGGLFRMFFGGGAAPAPEEARPPTREALRRIERMNEDIERERDDERPRRRARDEEDESGDNYRAPGGKGGYRTLCVRMCDGYYWPVSFSTKPSRFERDADVCKAACPNMEVELFVHRNPGQWSDDAVSVDGQPYTDLRNAFRYRKQFSGECACKPPMTPILREADREEDHGAVAPARKPALVPADTAATLQPDPIAGMINDAPEAASAPQKPAVPIVIMLHAQALPGRVTDEVGLRGAVPEQQPVASLAAGPSARDRAPAR